MKAERIFPSNKIVLMAIVLVVQIFLFTLSFNYEVKPQDIIRQYDITVFPQSDGSLDISYNFMWEAVDKTEELTWVEIGLANSNYQLYENSLSDNIKSVSYNNTADEALLVLYFDRAYKGGETLNFSFTVNQKDMLCINNTGYFYEFIPAWFNSIPVESYCFRWEDDENIYSAINGAREDGFIAWKGSLATGTYTSVFVQYIGDRFDGCDTVAYQPFDYSGVYNALTEDQKSISSLLAVIGALLTFFHITVIDSVVSYHRGRGFLKRYGYPMHIYGRDNPAYIYRRAALNARNRSGSGSSGGCACACACACAGGGRAGCSQKDTYQSTKNEAADSKNQLSTEG